MPVIVTIEGENKYKDDAAIESVIRYVINKPYCRFVNAVNAPVCVTNPIMTSNFFRAVQNNCYGKIVGSKIHHVIVALDDLLYVGDAEAMKIMDFVLGYFSYLQIPVFAAYHYRSEKRGDYPHIHLVISHVSLNGEIFFGSWSDFRTMKEFLNEHSNIPWRIKHLSRSEIWDEQWDELNGVV